MPLTSISTMMNHALQRHYAVGYFESWNLESLQGVIDAAESSRSPIVIGFNGEFLSHHNRATDAHERLSWYGALGKAAAESASVPVGFIFNECAHDDWVRQAVTAGFNLVMPVPAPGESGAQYTARVKSIVDLAHAQGVAVEAELGELPYGQAEPENAAHGHGAGEQTDPQHAAAFVAATGIDVLAVSVGNVHVLLQGQKALDIVKIAAIREATNVPLVLHGGTGIDQASIRQAIELGVAKVNYGTYVKLRYLDAMRRALASPEPDPHHLLGYGGSQDVLVAGRRAVRNAVLDRIAWLECHGKADLYD